MTDWTPEQLKEHRKLWVDALRSGEYPQGRNVLHFEGRYCCLGVACLVAGKSTAEMGSRPNLSKMRDVMTFFGLGDEIGTYSDRSDPIRKPCLASKNDDGVPFAAIADIIESEPDGLFVKGADL